MSKFSYLVYTPDGKIGVSDDWEGDRRVEQLFADYGDCKVEVRDHNAIWGKGIEYGKPLYVTSILKEWGNA